MINCPNCSNPVREDAKFCGNCGVDVQAALAAQEQVMAAQAAAAYQQQQSQPIQQAYPLQRTNYGGFDLRREERSPLSGRLLITAVLVVAVACAFCCGVIFGFEILSPMFPPISPKLTPTPTKQTLDLLQPVLSLVF